MPNLYNPRRFSYWLLFAFLCLLMLLLFVQPLFGQAPNRIIYVNHSATDGYANGVDWPNAYTDLRDALSNSNPGDEIWVAKGIYRAGYTDYFYLKDQVAVYGGFLGNEAARSQRDWQKNETHLTGKPSDENDFGIHAFRVVRGIGGLTEATILDGFYITGGYAVARGCHGSGGGLLIEDNSNPTLANLVISGNRAYYGGGMFNGGNPKMTNITFIGNSAVAGGGMLNHGKPIMEDIKFLKNSAVIGCEFGFDGYGAGMSNSGDLTMINVEFSKNTAEANGGGLRNGGKLAVINASFFGNSALNGGGIFSEGDFGSIHLTNVTLSGNSAENGGGMHVEHINRPVIRNSILWKNIANNGANLHQHSFPVDLAEISYSLIEGSGGSGDGWDESFGFDLGNNIDADPLFISELGILHLQENSPAVNAGLNSANETSNDLLGKSRIQDDVIDLGAFEGIYIPHHYYFPFVSN